VGLWWTLPLSSVRVTFGLPSSGSSSKLCFRGFNRAKGASWPRLCRSADLFLVGVFVGTFEAIGIKPEDVEMVIVPTGRVVVVFIQTVLVATSVKFSVSYRKV